MTLARYVAWRFLMAFLRVVLVTITLIFVFQFIENIRKHLDQADGLGSLVFLTILQIPLSLDRVLPLVMLLSSLTLFVSLARSSELVVTRASGVSALRILAVPVLVAVVMGVLAAMVFNPLVAATSKQFDAKLDEITKVDRSILSVGKDGFWLRQVVGERQSVINARRSSPDGSSLFDVEFHLFDQSGTLSERIVAEKADLDVDVWRLNDVRRWNVGPLESGNSGEHPIKRADTATLETNLTVEQILNSFAPPQTISFWDLGEFIDRLEKSGFAASRHKQYFQTILAAPALFAAMVLVGAGFTMRHVRFGKIGLMIFLTVFCGFTFYSFNNVAASLGAAGTIPAAMAAWVPSAGAILLVLGLLLHLEDG